MRQGCYVPLAVQWIYGWSNEGGEDEDGKEGSKFPGERERERERERINMEELWHKPRMHERGGKR